MKKRPAIPAKAGRICGTIPKAMTCQRLASQPNPDDWICPLCGTPKAEFDMVEI